MNAQRPTPGTILPSFLPTAPIAPLLALLLAIAPALPSSAAVEVIRVTATGREATTQSVPVAVTALDAQALERQGVTDMKSLAQLSPSLIVNSSNTETGGSTIRLRGVGTTGNNAGLEGSVGVFVDGVYLSRPGIAFSDLIDIERIEVLRGPQGTLFGRNTSAGAIDIKTRKPHFDGVEVRGDFTYGNYDQHLVTSVFNVPLVEDQLAFRFSGSYHTREGFLDSRIGSIRSNDRNRYLLRGQLLWEPIDILSVRIIGDYFQAEEHCCDAPIRHESPLFQGLFASGLGAALFPSGDNGVQSNFGFSALDDRRTNPNRRRQNDQDQWGISAQADAELPFGTLTYIGSYRDWFSWQAGDDDFTSNDIIRTERSPAAVDLVTQELRLQGEWEWVNWLFGAYYAHEEIDTHGRLGLGTQYENYANLIIGGLSGGALTVPTLTGVPNGQNFNFPNRTIGDNRFAQDTDAWALFTHNIFEIGQFVGLEDRLHLTMGLRYNWERKKGMYARGNPNNPGCDGLVNQTRGGGGLNLTGPLTNTAVGVICFPFVSTAVPSFDQTFQDDQFSGTVALSFDVTDEVMAYVSYSRGFKAGGFNLDSTAAIRNNPGAGTIPANPANDSAPGNFLQEGDASFDSETVDAFELGFKSDLLERQLRLNVTGFDYSIDDFQLLEFTGVSFVTDNVKAVKVRGIEAEIIATPPIEGLTLSSSVVYSDAYYERKGCSYNPASAILADRVCGRQLTNAPKWTVNLGGVYQHDLFPVGDYDLIGTFSMNYQYRGQRRAGTTPANVSAAPGGSEATNARTQKESNILDMRLGVSTADYMVSLEGWVRNVTDERTSQVLFQIPLRTGATGGFIDEPRMYGFTVRGRF